MSDVAERPRHPGRPGLAPLAVVFDLDDTLMDTLGQCVRAAQREAAAAMRAAGLTAPLESILALREAFQGQAVDLDRLVAETLGARDVERVAAAGRRAFFERDPGALVAHPFVPEVLAAVRARARCVLLTAGAPATQRTKLERLGLTDAFDEALFVDSLAGEDKHRALGAWIGRAGLPPSRVLVVGDRPQGEIAAALHLGCPALRIRAGEFAEQPTPPGVPEARDVRAVLASFPGLGAPCPPET